MFADDIALVKELADKYGPLPAGPIVDVGGLERPCVADYQITIDAMIELDRSVVVRGTSVWNERLGGAQQARYLQIHRPLSFLDPEYVCENPETGGLPIERLREKYDPAKGTGIGTAILLSVLEHVADPFLALYDLRKAMMPGGLVICSVPFVFPFHPSPEDCWRFTPTALGYIFDKTQWLMLECDWRLDIPYEAGILDIKTGRGQAIKSCYACARAI